MCLKWTKCDIYRRQAKFSFRFFIVFTRSHDVQKITTTHNVTLDTIVKATYDMPTTYLLLDSKHGTQKKDSKCIILIKKIGRSLGRSDQNKLGIVYF